MDISLSLNLVFQWLEVLVFYIKDDLFYNIHSDFTISKKEFEALWIEIVNFKGANVICGVIYRHSHGDLDCFMEYMSIGLERINREDKACVISGVPGPFIVGGVASHFYRRKGRFPFQLSNITIQIFLG
jgi:hypothetical protein